MYERGKIHVFLKCLSDEYCVLSNVHVGPKDFIGLVELRVL